MNLLFRTMGYSNEYLQFSNSYWQKEFQNIKILLYRQDDDWVYGRIPQLRCDVLLKGHLFVCLFPGYTVHLQYRFFPFGFSAKMKLSTYLFVPFRLEGCCALHLIYRFFRLNSTIRHAAISKRISISLFTLWPKICGLNDIRHRCVYYLSYRQSHYIFICKGICVTRFSKGWFAVVVTSSCIQFSISLVGKFSASKFCLKIVRRRTSRLFPSFSFFLASGLSIVTACVLLPFWEYNTSGHCVPS